MKKIFVVLCYITSLCYGGTFINGVDVGYQEVDVSLQDVSSRVSTLESSRAMTLPANTFLFQDLYPTGFLSVVSANSTNIVNTYTIPLDSIVASNANINLLVVEGSIGASTNLGKYVNISTQTNNIFNRLFLYCHTANQIIPNSGILGYSGDGDLYLNGTLVQGTIYVSVYGYGYNTYKFYSDDAFYVKYDQGAVAYDSRSDLMYARDLGIVGATGYTWSEATNFVDTLDYAGHTDWRMITYEEVMNIVDTNATPGDSGTTVLLAGHPFTNVTAYAPGGELPGAVFQHNMWIDNSPENAINIWDGTVFDGTTNMFGVIVVRDR